MNKMNHHTKPSPSSMVNRHRWRKRSALIPILGAIIALSNGLPAAADSINVAYTATKVSGSTWEYAYTLSGSISSGDLLAIYFPLATSSGITNLSVATPVFTTSVLQPDASIPADGEYDITANSTTTTFSDAFDIAFTYSGSGTPNSQSFTLYDSSFATITSGTTAAANTPEASSVTLLAGGLAVLFGLIRRVRN